MDIPNFVAEELAEALQALVKELEGMEDVCPSYDRAKRALADMKFWSQVGSYCNGG